MMQDFYLEQRRDAINEDWDDSVTAPILAEKLKVDRVPYRIYYSKDNLTRRIFLFRPHCNEFEIETLTGLGFVFANPGDSENIPDQPVDEEELNDATSSTNMKVA